MESDSRRLRIVRLLLDEKDLLKPASGHRTPFPHLVPSVRLAHVSAFECAHGHYSAYGARSNSLLMSENLRFVRSQWLTQTEKGTRKLVYVRPISS